MPSMPRDGRERSSASEETHERHRPRSRDGPPDRPARLRQRRRRWRSAPRCCPKWSWALALDAQAAAAERSPTTTRRAAPACAAAMPGRSRWRTSCATAGALDLAGAAHTGETYDLVVVGGGLSGLAAAYYFVPNVGRVRARARARQPRRLRRPRQAQRVRRRRQAAGAERRHAQHRVAAALQPAVAAAARRASASTSIASSRTTRRTAASIPALGLRSGHFFDKETWGRDQLAVRPAAGGRRRGGFRRSISS